MGQDPTKRIRFVDIFSVFKPYTLYNSSLKVHQLGVSVIDIVPQFEVLSYYEKYY